MYGVELYAAVRLAVVDEGLSHHEAGRRFGIDRRTVKKMLSYSAPPGYRRTKPVRRPKLDGFTGIVDAILEADTDPDVPRKQRHTAHRIFERLRDEHGFSGGYTIVKDYVRSRRQSVREAFVPLHHPPGHAQVDFGEAVVELRGQREKVAFFCLILPHSNVWFVKAYPRETTEAFLDGHVSAFAFLGGVPRSILYDNTTLAVARILGDGTRRRTQAFSHLQSHYLFRDRFGRPGILGVIGGLYAGVVTPTEAGAAGAFLAFAIAFAQGRLNWTVFRDSLVEAIASTARILFVAIGAVLYSKFLALTGLPVFLGGAMDDWALDPLFLVLAAAAMYVVLGMFLDPLGLMLLTLLVLLPMFEGLGLDLIWFGVLVVKFLEIGLLTPPVGFNVYVIKSVVGDKRPDQRRVDDAFAGGGLEAGDRPSSSAAQGPANRGLRSRRRSRLVRRGRGVAIRSHGGDRGGAGYPVPGGSREAG